MAKAGAKAEDFEVKGTKLTFEFENELALNHFKDWMCGSGEQQYWQWMEYREEEKENVGDITGVDFDYWDGATIKVKCSRMNKEEE